MQYKLKPGVESFEIVDGAFAGKKYFRGKVYEKIPPEEKHKFEKVGGEEGKKVEKQKEEKTKPLNLEPGTATERSKP